jgi:3-phosphoshikimate 1-carboxyvinyltransferase
MSDFTYPPTLEIVPLSSPPSATVTVPGSKSITNRALVLAALASRSGPCVLAGALRSEDTEVMLDCLTKLGFVVEADWRTSQVVVHRNQTDRIIPAESADLFVANSGTTMRFLTAMVSLGDGCYRLDGVPRMRERPIGDLLDALTQLGIDTVSEAGNGCPPVVITTSGWPREGTKEISIRADSSSQFLSGLLMAAAFAPTHTFLSPASSLVSEPYVAMTEKMLVTWNRAPFHFPNGEFEFPVNPETPVPHSYAVEPDASAASYFWAAAAIGGGRVTVSGLNRKSLQGDVAFVDVLEQMGCRVEECDSGITVHGRPLRGVDVDMNAISDTVMTLAAVALFADGPTTIRNVAHIRHKETDRIAALATELRKLGAGVEERGDGLTITPQTLTGCAVDTYNDHRMAMSLALVGLKVPGVVVRDPGCVAKTYPGYWRDLSAVASCQ